MGTGLQGMMLAGALVAAGLVTVVLQLAPAHPDLVDVLARLSPTRARSGAPARGDTDDPHEKLGRFALRHFPAVVWARTPIRELALLRIPLARFYGEKVLFAVVALVGVPILAGLIGLVTPLPWAVPVLATVALGAGMWFLPNLFVVEDAKLARADFNRALGAYIDLVAMARNNGAGPRQAMEVAAATSDSWVFARIREELARSRWSQQPPWDALHVLADDLGLSELDDLADIMRLGGEEGAQVYKTLRARSAALRNAMLNTELAQANAANERMTMPASLLGIVFLAILLGPALMRLAA